MTLELGLDPLLALAERIRTKEATVAVVGLGYVGLPLLVEAANAGFPTVGYDVDGSKIDSLRSSRSYIVDITDSDIASVESGVFSSRWSTLPGSIRSGE